MKYTHCVFLYLLLSGTLFAQRHQSADPFVYSNVARNQYNTPISNRAIVVEVSILKTSATGSVIYSERHSTTTSFFGEYDITLGEGEMKKGRFENINWTNETFYLGIAIDTAEGTNFVALGTPQLLHAPDILYDKATGEVKAGKARKGFEHYLGEQFGGGIIYSLWKDAAGKEHGLIVALNDQSDSVPWSNIDTTAIGLNSQSVWNGPLNTSEITRQPGYKSGAALVCQNYTAGGFNDWYLPSISEFNLLYCNRNKIKKALDMAGKPMGHYNYWSSTEYAAGSAWVFATNAGPVNNYIFSKYSMFNVRAIRAF